MDSPDEKVTYYCQFPDCSNTFQAKQGSRRQYCDEHLSALVRHKIGNTGGRPIRVSLSKTGVKEKEVLRKAKK